MHELEAKHLVQRRTGRGTTVSEQTEPVSRLYAELDGNTDASLDDATELRLIVEPRIASAAALRSAPSNLVQLEDVLTRSALRLEAETSLQLDLEFHLLLAHAVQNPLLVALCTMTSTWTESLRRHSHATLEGRLRSLEGHQAIYQAVQARDPDAAAAAMNEHLSVIRDVIARAPADAGGPHEPSVVSPCRDPDRHEDGDCGDRRDNEHGGRDLDVQNLRSVRDQADVEHQTDRGRGRDRQGARDELRRDAADELAEPDPRQHSRYAGRVVRRAVARAGIREQPAHDR
jgi:DNA-binding FadR family transcriptional regulator